MLSTGWPSCLGHSTDYVVSSARDMVVVDVHHDTLQPIISYGLFVTSMGEDAS